MPLNSSGPISLAGTTVGVSIQKELGGTGTTQISLNDAAVRSLAGIASGAITMPTNFWGKGGFQPTQKGIFGYGYTTNLSTVVSMTNLVSNTGVVSGDTAGVGTARRYLSACGYGGDKGIFAFGGIPTSPYQVSSTNLVSNTGVVASNTTTALPIRANSAACGYGGDKGIIDFGQTSGTTTEAILVSNTGVLTATGLYVGTARNWLAACSYGGDKGIFGYGGNAITKYNMTNKVSNIH
jgi:hypothetical protein